MRVRRVLRSQIEVPPAKLAQLAHLIGPVLKIALQQQQSFKTEASPANLHTICRVSGFVQF